MTLTIAGWMGFVGLMLFYWMLGSGKVLQAYIWGTAGAIAWLAVGVATMLGYSGPLPSLVLMEAMVVIMNIRGIILWKRAQNDNSDN